jgi:hypothetical protein
MSDLKENISLNKRQGRVEILGDDYLFVVIHPNEGEVASFPIAQ